MGPWRDGGPGGRVRQSRRYLVSGELSRTTTTPVAQGGDWMSPRPLVALDGDRSRAAHWERRWLSLRECAWLLGWSTPFDGGASHAPNRVSFLRLEARRNPRDFGPVDSRSIAETLQDKDRRPFLRATALLRSLRSRRASSISRESVFAARPTSPSGLDSRLRLRRSSRSFRSRSASASANSARSANGAVGE